MKNYSFFTISFALFFMASSFLSKAQVPGKALVFDGDDDFVDVPTVFSDELNPLKSLTLECWAYLNEVPSSTHTPNLIARFNCYTLTVASSEHARGYIRDDEGVWHEAGGTTVIATNTWYHLALTYDGSNMRIFVNGEEEGSAPVSDTMARTTDNFRIGSRNAYVTTTNTNGIIDEARVWDVARTREEIRASMNRTIPGNTPGLVGYWRFDEGSGTNADCQTSYDNDGTLMHMAVPGVWVTSTAAMGDVSIFAESADITETSECSVDVVFAASPEGPGPGHSMAVMQVNGLPNSLSGLYPDKASLYWEIWSEDPDFDGNFTADVRFHYDAIGGLPSESSLQLFRRDDANGTWSPATGYTVVSNDGGSSTATDGVGYVELTTSEATTGGFSGQYILSWSNAPPVVSNIPDQSVAEGSVFAAIALDNYVIDPDNADDELTWTVSGEDDVAVSITDRVASITADDPDWNGTDVVLLIATDPEGESDSQQVTFEVTPVDDPPVVGDIPDQQIAEGASFTTIVLDDYVSDVDDPDSTLTWSVSGNADMSVDIINRVATITVNDPQWNGSEIITFLSRDPNGETDSDQATFVVTMVNDAPQIEAIPNQTINEGEGFTQINLDDYVSDAEDADSILIWSVSGDSEVSVDITNRVATITVNDPEWNGRDGVLFTVEDSEGLTASDNVMFTVSPVNDLPVVAGIPDQAIAEGQSFGQINLDDFVIDADHSDDSLSWTASGQSGITVSILDRVATFTLDPEWNGTDTIVFAAADPLGGQGSDTAVFTVTPINDPPMLAKAIPDTSAVAQEAFSLVLDPSTFEDIDAGDSLVYSASMSKSGSTPAWITFDPATVTFSGTPADTDKGMVEVIVTATDASLASVSDTFSIEVISYVGIINPLADLEIKLYPNPNNGRFVIESDRFEMKDVVLEIFNEKGQLIWNREINVEMGGLHESVDLGNSPNGLYLLRMRNHSGVLNKRFVISY